MPPKAKFTRTEITEAAFNIVEEGGVKALTARALGTKLQSSARPIFTAFDNMEDVMREVKVLVRQRYAEYVNEGLKQTEIPAFKGVGMQYIMFAIKEPKLFQMLFMTEQEEKPTVANVLPIIEDNYEAILLSVKDSYGLSREDSEWMYRHLWIYTHGIAVLCATNMCVFTGEELGKMLTEVCMAMLEQKRLEKGSE